MKKEKSTVTTGLYIFLSREAGWGGWVVGRNVDKINILTSYFSPQAY